MPTSQFTTRLIGHPPEDVFAWHASPGGVHRLMPPWSGVQVVRAAAPLAAGAEAEFSIPAGPFRMRWRAIHPWVEAPRGFIDEQLSGPFRLWRHEHRFERTADGTELVDAIDWQLPGYARWMAARIDRDLVRLFAWRHARTRRDLDRLARFHRRPRLTIAVTGATGLVGRQLTAFLRSGGHTVIPVVRDAAHQPRAGVITWDPPRSWIDQATLARCQAVIHLAGESVAQRWTDAAKTRIRDSRVQGTRLLAETLARAVDPITSPALICASGINAYPMDQVRHHEDDGSAEGGTATSFLAGVVRAWEAAADPARRAGIRTVHLRIGFVLAPDGGGLPQLLRPFSLGLGGPIDGGGQGLSWISLDDLVGMLHSAALDPAWSGVVNAVSPAPTDQRGFARTLGAVLHRPAILPTPAWPLRLALGEMAEELAIGGVFAEPRRAGALGFTWLDPDLEPALRFALGR